MSSTPNSTTNSIKNSFSLIYSIPGFAVVNKPFDCAMDSENQPEGKLNVQDWAEKTQDGKSMLQIATGMITDQQQNENNNDDEEPTTTSSLSSSCQRQEIPSIGEKQKKRNTKDTIDGKVRFVHQLDYSTSGLLCLTFSKRQAAKVTFCFETRSSKKEYLAVLDGWIDEGKGIDYEHDHDDEKKEHAATSSQMTPIENIIENLKSNCTTSSMQRVIKNLEAAVTSSKQQQQSQNDEEARKRGIAIPTRLFVNVPIGHDNEDPRGFKMRAVSEEKEKEEQDTQKPPSIRERMKNDDATEEQQQQPQLKVRNPKTASTIITVLSRGFIIARGNNNKQQIGCSSVPNRKCTLVHFQLLTGRRHQLRIHSKVIGHPIVGDRVYNPRDIINNENKNDNDAIVDSGEGIVERMMLHAWRLGLPKDAIALAQSGAEESELSKSRRREIKQVRKGGEEPRCCSSKKMDADADEGLIHFVAPETLTEYFEPVV